MLVELLSPLEHFPKFEKLVNFKPRGYCVDGVIRIVGEGHEQVAHGNGSQYVKNQHIVHVIVLDQLAVCRNLKVFSFIFDHADFWGYQDVKDKYNRCEDVDR